MEIFLGEEEPDLPSEGLPRPSLPKLPPDGLSHDSLGGWWMDSLNRSGESLEKCRVTYDARRDVQKEGS